MPLRIAHLSDIHFKNNAEQVGFDADDSMREDVVRDLIDLTDEFGKLDAIVISGDIAYSGKAEEFILARRWLYDLVNKAGSTDTKIMICPGNHDIDRDVFKKNKLILDAHDAIRLSRNVEKIQDALIDRLKDPSLMQSLENYNNFAVEFGCEFYPDRDRYSWFKDLELNDGSRLRVRGLNSTILCGVKDQKKSLYLGRNAWSLKKEDGVEYLAFAHHPPSWLFDETEMKNELDDRAKIQLYGHEHYAKIDPGVNSVRLYAGAVNPERDHDSWSPGFNFLQVWVETAGEKRAMVVKVNSRQWQATAPSQFTMYRGKETDGTHKYIFDLTKWDSRFAKTQQDTIGHRAPIITSSKELTKMSLDNGTVPPITEQALLRLFFNLTFVQQKGILDEMGLTDPGDSNLPHFIQIKNGLKRARDRQLIDKLKEVLLKKDHT